MSTNRKVVRNIFWLAIEPTLRALIAVPMAGFVAKHLGLTGYGQLAFALSFVTLFGAIANLGLNEVLVRTIARQPADEAKLWSSVVVTKAMLLAVYLAIVSSVAYGSGYSRSLIIVIVLMGIFQGLLSLENATVSVFAARQHLKPIATLGLVKAVTEAAVTVGVLLLGFTVVGLATSRALLAILSLLATVLLAFWTLKLRAMTPSAAAVRPLMGAGLTFAGITVLISAGARGGVLLLEHARGVEAVALFSAAMALVDRLLLFLPAILGAIFPFFSAIGAHEETRFSTSLDRAFRYQCLMGTGLGLAIALFGPWVLQAIFPPGFEEASLVIQVLGPYVSLRAANGLLTSATQARGLEKLLARAWGLQCLANLVLAAALVSPFGAVGLAWAIVASETIPLSLLVALLKRRGGFGVSRWSSVLSPAVAAIAIFAGFEMIPGTRHGLLMPLAFAAAYPLFLVAARAVSQDDYRYVLLLLKGASRA